MKEKNPKKERKHKHGPLEQRNNEIMFRARQKLRLWMKENKVFIPQDAKLREEFLSEMKRAEILLQRLDEHNLNPADYGGPVIPLPEIRALERELGESLNKMQILCKMDLKKRSF